MLERSRTMYAKENYIPCRINENDEIFRNGIFHFNISKILEDILSGEVVVEKEVIEIKEWFRKNGYHAVLNESHLPTVDITKPIIQAEIRSGIFTIIDGNHRIEKAFRLGVPSIHSYKLMGEQLIPYFITSKGYYVFVEYWNSKL